MAATNDWQSALGALLDSGNLPDGEPIAQSAPKENVAPKRDRLTISYERKGRAGKEATIISGFTIPHEEVATIASTLKSKLGTGGSARGGEILIQGDRREKVAAMLREMGYRL